MYVIHQKRRREDGPLEEPPVRESLQNGLVLLRGRTFDDRERWTLGVGAYQRQCAPIRRELNVSRGDYKLMEHFLFWRLQMLLACRTYASLYLGGILEKGLFSQGKEALARLKKNYDRFCFFFTDHLEIRNDLQSIIDGIPLLWKGGGRCEYMESIPELAL